MFVPAWYAELISAAHHIRFRVSEVMSTTTLPWGISDHHIRKGFLLAKIAPNKIPQKIVIAQQKISQKNKTSSRKAQDFQDIQDVGTVLWNFRSDHTDHDCVWTMYASSSFQLKCLSSVIFLQLVYKVANNQQPWRGSFTLSMAGL